MVSKDDSKFAEKMGLTLKEDVEVFDSKNPVVKNFIQELFPNFTAKIAEGKCPFCGKEPGEFRDALSKKEYGISGLCQACQDKTFGGSDED